MQLVDNTRESLAAFLAAQLTHASDVLIHVAYLRQSGVAVLETELQAFLGRGGSLRLLCGADFGLTEPEAIRQLLSWNAQVRLHISRDIAGFHPKSYLLLGPDGATLVVGSSNLTRGGLIDNVELNLVVQQPRDHPLVVQAISLFEKLWRTTPTLTPERLEHYSAWQAAQSAGLGQLHYVPPPRDRDPRGGHHAARYSTVGGTLLAHLSTTGGALDPDPEAAVSLRQALDGLYTRAFEHAQAISQEHGETVTEKRRRDIQIQIEDLERWYQARSQVHQQRLKDYRHRLALGEDMNVAIRGEERKLSDVQDTYDSRKIELESQRTVVSQAPELLNLALTLNQPGESD